ETKIKSGIFFMVSLPVALDPGSKISVIVETNTHVLQPYSTQITQSKRFVVSGNHYFFSPYPTKTQTMHVKLASGNVESYTKLGNPVCTEDLLDYGPLRYVPDTFKIHYENSSPFLTITSMTYITEVSHWGNIAVEGNMGLKHTGAVLKGHLMRDSLIADILPAAAHDVYYQNEIGYISTSHLFILNDSVAIEPHFPLFGGQKTHYITEPPKEYLYNLGDQNALKMRLDHVFEKQVVDLTVKIILPERVKNIQIDSFYEISCAPDELHYTYLNTFDRPVIVAYKKNLVEQYIHGIVVFSFNKVLVLQEPQLVVAAFNILFFTVIIYVWLDFSITMDLATEARMKMSCITEKDLTLVTERIDHLDKTVNRYEQSWDVSTFNSGKKSLETEHKAFTSETALLQCRLKECSDLRDRVSKMQKLDAQVKKLECKSGVEAEWLMPGKLKKDTYVKNEKLMELVTKIGHILAAL
uniref:Dolichyl-diphosphooligosaccharide--protein glycosyltransferase subunit 1 n=1 Tax=Otolemur garnettii TaxID=30611 RepID=H0XT81_OTOGA